MFRERSLARSPHSLGAAQIADTSSGFAVALEAERPDQEDVEAVHLTVVTCND